MTKLSETIEGEYAARREMVDSFRQHGGADLPDWPLRLLPVHEDKGQLGVDRFYRYIESLQELVNAAADIETRFAA